MRFCWRKLLSCQNEILLSIIQNVLNRKPFKYIRNAVRALIIRRGKLLVVTLRDREGPFYILPGGGQQHGESIQEALRRECFEELGIPVEVKELVYVRDYVGRNHGFAQKHWHFHQLEVVFRCTLKGKITRPTNSSKDNLQINLEWLDLLEMKEARFYPEAIKSFFKKGIWNAKVQYLGDIN